MKAPPEAPFGRDASDEVMTNLAQKKINAFSGFGHGFYFWNFRTDLDEPHWSYMLALDRGWIPKGNLNDPKIVNACHNEDNGLYVCISKRNQLEGNIKKGIEYVLKTDGKTIDGETELLLNCKAADITILSNTTLNNMSGDKLFEVADCAYNFYWDKHRLEGATCDFGGSAALVEVNATYSDDDDSIKYPDGIIIDLKAVELAGIIGVGIFLGAFIGFAVAMRCNKGFNRTVSHSGLGQTMKKNPLLRRSFGGFTDDYESIP